MIISNFEKLRLYIENTIDFREWNLFTLNEDDFRELYLCLAWEQVKKGCAIKLACGSGAFLNAALQFLMAEHRLINEMEAKVAGSSLVFQDVENSILENNLFGVDINEESVEIAQLALWTTVSMCSTILESSKMNRLTRSLNWMWMDLIHKEMVRFAKRESSTVLAEDSF